MENITFFYCYDKRLKNLLLNNGQNYTCTGLHQQTLNQFWQFQLTPEIERIISEHNNKIKTK